MNKENIKRMKVLDDETIDKDPVDGDLLTRDIVHYVGKKPKPPRLGLIYYAWKIGALNGQWK